MHIIYRNMRILGFSLPLLFLFTNIQIYSQSLPFVTYSVRDGIATNIVYYSSQDKNGKMWFATDIGVSSYDGYEWINYDVKDGLPETEYISLCVDDKNRIWALPRTNKQNVVFYDGKRWNQLPNPNRKKIIEYSSFDLINTRDGIILYAATDGGVLVFENNKWKMLTKKDGLLDNRINYLTRNANNIFICTQKGLSVISNDKIDNSINSKIKAQFKNILSIDFGKNNSEENAGNKSIWLLGENWIGSLDAERNFHLLSNSVRLSKASIIKQYHFRYDGKSRIFYGNEFEKFFIDINSSKISALGIHQGFVSNGSLSVFLDREMNVWFTSFRGINKIGSMCFDNFYKDNGMLENEVAAIAEIQPDYFLFGHNTGYSIYKNGRFTTTSFINTIEDTFPITRVIDINKDTSENIWLTISYSGIGKLKTNGSIQLIRDSKISRYSSLLIDRKEEIWVSTNEGLFKIFNDKLIMVTDLTKARFRARRLFQDKTGTLYAATSNGIAVFRDGKYTVITSNYGASANNFYNIYQYTNSKLMLASAHGLFLLENGSIKKFNENNFSIDSKIFSIKKDKNNNYWFGTDDGVIKWDGKTSKKYTIENGLAGREINRESLFVDSSGKVWIGTESGLSRYNPQYDILKYPPTLQLLFLEKPDGTKYELNKQIELDASERNISFFFRGISFDNEKFIKYKVKLEGFDNRWVDVGTNSFARYTNLEPGGYRFIVEAMNIGGNWSLPAASQKIFIEKPFYARWWFILFASLVTGFIYYSVYTYISQKKYSTMLEREVEERTKNLQVSEGKLRTIFDNAPNTIAVINKEGEILFVNHPLQEFETTEYIRKNILDNIPEEDVEYLKNILTDVFNNKNTVSYEINYKDENGTEHWIENSISPVINEHDISEAIIISSDATERKINDIARKEIEERQNAILTGLPLVLYNSSSRSKFAATWITENVSSLTGFDVNKFLREEYFWGSRIHPDDKEFVLKEYESISLGKSIKLEYRWLCADGYYKWFLDYAAPKGISESDEKEFLGIWLDITERKQMQQRLEKLNECFLNFSINPRDNIQRLITLCGIETYTSFVLYNLLLDNTIQNIASWNLQEEIVPFTMEGRIISEVFKNNNKELVVINNVGQTGYAETDPIVTQLGIKTYIGVPIILGDKTTGALCLIYQNQRQISESDLKFISIISSAIAVEEERRISQEIIKSSLAEKEILLKEIHHRVKNNLQVISSLLYLQSADIKDEKTLSMFIDSTSRVRSMALIHEILYQSTDFANINFEEYINNLVADIFSTYSVKLTVTKQIEVDQLFLSVDTAILSGLIVNELVINSIKYAFPAGFIDNPVILVSVKTNKDKIIIVIADNGIGLPEEINIEKEQSTLGLKLVRMLTNQLDGKIQLEKQGGTKFQITFNNKK